MKGLGHSITGIVAAGALAAVPMVVSWCFRRSPGDETDCRSTLRMMGIAMHMYAQDNDGWTPAIQPVAMEAANEAGVPGGCVVAFGDKEGKWRASGLGLLIEGGVLAANERVVRVDREPLIDPPWCYCPLTHGTDQRWVNAFTVDRDEVFWRTGKPGPSDGDGVGELPGNPAVMVCSYTLRPNTENARGSFRLDDFAGHAVASDLLFFGESGAVENHAGAYNVLFSDGSQRQFVDKDGRIAAACRGVKAEEIDETVERIFGELFDPLYREW